jgi:protein SCO1
MSSLGRVAGAIGGALLVAACAAGGTPGTSDGQTGGVSAPTDPAATPTTVWVETITQPPMGHRETAYDPARPAPVLRLTDGDGRPFDLASLQGEPVFVYFGYTHCPDICPTTLADLRAAIAKAGVAARVVFVTIDPARDDAAAMKQYTGFYQAGFIGLTGTAARIAETASAWGISYRRLPSDSAAGYAMVHSTDVYLVDAAGVLRHHIYYGADADLIARLLKEVTAP